MTSTRFDKNPWYICRIFGLTYDSANGYALVAKQIPPTISNDLIRVSRFGISP